MKSVLISIKPQWCALIASGKKTIEVRKMRPKLEAPFKCYTYCTKGHLAMLRDNKDSEEPYKYDVWEHAGFHESCGKTILGGKIIGEFVCDEILPIMVEYSDPSSKIALIEFPFTCLTDKQIIDYLGNGKQGYGWHISDLVMYDKPRELMEFRVTRSPQSWCYVEGDRRK